MHVFAFYYDSTMHIAIASDHTGVDRKAEVVAALRADGHTVDDLGTDSTAPVDYPDYAERLGLAVIDGRAERGVLICGSGVGASVAANKIPGIRASVCHDSYSAHQGVEHDNMNILVFGARVIGSELAKELARIFVAARFTGEARHVRRLAKVHAMEERYGMQMPVGSATRSS
ncbi:MAG: ribose 5-phosphate isomerase B [Gemmatimonadales bacterium]